MSRDELDTPRRLADVARIVMGDAAPSVAWLRSQAKAGRLVTYRIAGKDFTTERAFREMLEKCALKGQDSGSDRPPVERTRVSSETEAGKSALDALRLTAQKLKSNSGNRSPNRVGRSRDALTSDNS